MNTNENGSNLTSDIDAFYLFIFFVQFRLGTCHLRNTELSDWTGQTQVQGGHFGRDPRGLSAHETEA